MGILIFAASSFMNTTMSFDYSGDQLWLPNIVRAIGQALVITPLTAVATASITTRKIWLIQLGGTMSLFSCPGWEHSRIVASQNNVSEVEIVGLSLVEAGKARREG